MKTILAHKSRSQPARREESSVVNASTQREAHFGAATPVLQPKLTAQKPNETRVQRREFGPLEDPAAMTDGDWTHFDRLNKTNRWRQANDVNLRNGRSSQYMQIDQRRDFYLWFYEIMRARGHEIRWPLAAYVVAGGANEVANRDPAGTNFMRPNSLEAMMRRGNQVIFNDVFPKLQALYARQDRLTGAAAQAWDAQTLGEEQNLIQPLYSTMSPADLATMNDLVRQRGTLTSIGSSIFGRVDAGMYNSGGAVPPFPDDYDLTNPEHRFRYGMMLADFFSETPSGVDQATRRAGSSGRAEAVAIPNVPASYSNGEMLRRMDGYQTLHRFTSMLSDVGLDRAAATRLLHQMTPDERRVITTDPWYTAILRHRHQMSMNEAISFLNAEDISSCGPLFQLIGYVDGVGDAQADDNVMVWWENSSGWTTFGGSQRVSVQAVSDSAYRLFNPTTHSQWVYVNQLHCQRLPTPPPIPDPIEQAYSLYFDTSNADPTTDSHEWENRDVLDQILTELTSFGRNAQVSNLELLITGHASPRWRGRPRATDAFAENFRLAQNRANNVEHYLSDAYSAYHGPMPMVVLRPIVRALTSPDVLPTDNRTVGGLGSIQGLLETFDTANDDQRYRRVDVRLRVVFDPANTTTPDQRHQP